MRIGKRNGLRVVLLCAIVTPPIVRGGLNPFQNQNIQKQGKKEPAMSLTVTTPPKDFEPQITPSEEIILNKLEAPNTPTITANTLLQAANGNSANANIDKKDKQFSPERSKNFLKILKYIGVKNLQTSYPFEINSDYAGEYVETRDAVHIFVYPKEPTVLGFSETIIPLGEIQKVKDQLLVFNPPYNSKVPEYGTRFSAFMNDGYKKLSPGSVTIKYADSLEGLKERKGIKVEKSTDPIPTKEKWSSK